MIAAVTLAAAADRLQAQADTSQEASYEPQAAGLAAGISMEEVTVYGDRTLNSLRLEVYAAEEAFYDAYNAANDNDEFDISCAQRSPTGTRMRRRVCEARFVKDLNAEFAKAFLWGDPLPPINPMMMFKGRQLVDDMRAVARANPAVLNSLVELAEIRMRFEAERERRCSGRIFCSRNP